LFPNLTLPKKELTKDKKKLLGVSFEKEKEDFEFEKQSSSSSSEELESKDLLLKEIELLLKMAASLQISRRCSQNPTGIRT
jgi:hypothetical protein